MIKWKRKIIDLLEIVAIVVNLKQLIAVNQNLLLIAIINLLDLINQNRRELPFPFLYLRDSNNRWYERYIIIPVTISNKYPKILLFIFLIKNIHIRYPNNSEKPEINV